jgi:hypothetical protein
MMNFLKRWQEPKVAWPTHIQVFDEIDQINSKFLAPGGSFGESWGREKNCGISSILLRSSIYTILRRLPPRFHPLSAISRPVEPPDFDALSIVFPSFDSLSSELLLKHS